LAEGNLDAQYQTQRGTSDFLPRTEPGPGRSGYGPAVPALILHGMVGLALIAGSISPAARAAAARMRQIVAPAVTAAVVLLAAAANGA
jgi:hypothetical protein